MPARKVFRIKYVVFCIATALTLSITYHLSLVSAQSPSPTSAIEKAQSDYNFQFTKYRNAQEKYASAKEEYKSFQTATAKNNAYLKTKDYLIQVDKLYKAYFSLVQETGNSINFTAHGDDKNKINNIIKNETDYLDEHTQKINQTKTLEELPPLSQELKTHITEISQEKLNKVFAIYEVVEGEAGLDDFNSLSRILDRVVIFKLRAGETKSILANWSSEIKDLRTKTETSLAKARETLAKTPEDNVSDGDLARVAEIAQDAKKQLKRSKPLFEEVVRII